MGVLSVADLFDAYSEAHERLSAVLDDLNEEQANTVVGACPGWSVRDVVAHHCGAVIDSVTGNFSELASAELLEQWRDPQVAHARDTLTARQVSERTGRSLTSLVREWRDATARLAPMMRGEQAFPGSVPAIIRHVLINDVVVHEGDIRSALGLGPVRDGVALSVALAGYSFSLDYRLQQVGLRPLLLEYDGKQRRVGGDGEPGATLRSTRYELVRCLASRRTATEILTYDWSGDAKPYVPVLPEYGPLRA
jgi:uncharacterized protein (TIGR03083 family)